VNDYTQQATRAVLAAARSEHSFAEWLAYVLAAVAGQLGSSDALTAGKSRKTPTGTAARISKSAPSTASRQAQCQTLRREGHGGGWNDQH
jgi:hypothetical protein